MVGFKEKTGFTLFLIFDRKSFLVMACLIVSCLHILLLNVCFLVSHSTVKRSQGQDETCFPCWMHKSSQCFISEFVWIREGFAQCRSYSVAGMLIYVSQRNNSSQHGFEDLLKLYKIHCYLFCSLIVGCPRFLGCSCNCPLSWSPYFCSQLSQIE